MEDKPCKLGRELFSSGSRQTKDDSPTYFSLRFMANQ